MRGIAKGQSRRGQSRFPSRAFIKMLRRKLGDDAANPSYIFTERRVGYRMPSPSES